MLHNGEVRICKHIILRLVQVSDAKVLLALRRDSKLNQHLSPVENNLKKQEAWLSAYKEREKLELEYYFVVSSLDNEPLGAVRLYDFKGDSFCWGSWMVDPKAPNYTAIESALSVYDFGFYALGFKRSHFNVRKANLKVVKFHKGSGAKIISSDKENHYFEYQLSNYEKIRKKYTKFLLGHLVSN